MFQFLKRFLTLPVLGALLLVPGAAQAQSTVKIAYIPILPMAQLFPRGRLSFRRSLPETST